MSVAAVFLAANLFIDIAAVHAEEPQGEPEPDEDDSLDFSDGLYAINAVPLTVLGKGESQLQYNIATQLVNTTLNFGMTTARDLWVSNAGMLQLYEPVSSVDDPSGLGIVLEGDAYASPLACPSGFVVQDDDTLIFMSQEAYCAQKTGMTISDRSQDEEYMLSNFSHNRCKLYYFILE